MKDVQVKQQKSVGRKGLPVKHLTLRLPCGPDFSGDADESTALTRLRAMRELLHGRRVTMHALICEIIDTALAGGVVLPFPKRPAIPSRASQEYMDLRLTKPQLDSLDALRDSFQAPEVLDPREYYSRPDVVRELLWLEGRRVQAAFEASAWKQVNRR